MSTATSKPRRTKSEDTMSVTSLASWYGTNRMFAEHVGKALDGCSWVGVPFAGSMCELPYIKARTLQVNDLHRHIINLAEVAGDARLAPGLYRRLRRAVYHPDVLERAQTVCQQFVLSDQADVKLFDMKPQEWTVNRHPQARLDWAEAYFKVAWMTRHGSAGTPAEFKSGPSLRWNANGGDSAAHFHNAVRELPKWRKVLRRCNFTTLDCFEFLANCKDADGHGVYADPPFPDAGEKYTHSFTEEQQGRLAGVLNAYQHTRVVVRYHDHPLIRKLYPESRWTWIERQGRTQTNGAAKEVLLVLNAQESHP